MTPTAQVSAALIMHERSAEPRAPQPAHIETFTMCHTIIFIIIIEVLFAAYRGCGANGTQTKTMIYRTQ